MSRIETKTRVLVVDDEKTIADTLAVILTRAGFLAFPVYDGSEAIELAEILKPDLLITDVQMPEMNGVETAVHIRQILPACKVLLFSGHAATADFLLNARGCGYDFEIISKPINPADLLQKLRSDAHS